jgi:hypothetical protein
VLLGQSFKTAQELNRYRKAVNRENDAAAAAALGSAS